MPQGEINITVDNLTPLMKGLELDTGDEDVKDVILEALLDCECIHHHLLHSRHYCLGINVIMTSLFGSVTAVVVQVNLVSDIFVYLLHDYCYCPSYFCAFVHRRCLCAVCALFVRCSCAVCALFVRMERFGC